VEEDFVVDAPGAPVVEEVSQPLPKANTVVAVELAKRKDEVGLDHFFSLCAVICILLSWVLPWALSLLGVPEEQHHMGDYQHNDCSP